MPLSSNGAVGIVWESSNEVSSGKNDALLSCPQSWPRDAIIPHTKVALPASGTTGKYPLINFPWRRMRRTLYYVCRFWFISVWRIAKKRLLKLWKNPCGVLIEWDWVSRKIVAESGIERCMGSMQTQRQIKESKSQLGFLGGLWFCILSKTKHVCPGSTSAE